MVELDPIVQSAIHTGLLPDQIGMSRDSMRGSPQYIRARDIDAKGQLDNGMDRRRDELSYHEALVLVESGLMSAEKSPYFLPDAVVAATAPPDPYGSDTGRFDPATVNPTTFEVEGQRTPGLMPQGTSRANPTPNTYPTSPSVESRPATQTETVNIPPPFGSESSES